jgi:hypothetical protein
MRVPEGGADAADAIGLRFSHDGGAHFGTTALARSPDGRFAADPGIGALPSGAFVVTWLAFRAKPHEEAYDMRVVAAVARPGDGALGTPVLVTSDEGEHEYDRPWPTVTSRGTIVVGYRSGFRGDGGVSIARSTDGVTWRRSELLSRFQFAGGLVTTCAAADADNVYVAYLDPVEGIIVRASHDDGETFPDQRSASAKDENVALEAPSCVASGEDVVVAYGVGRGPIDTGESAVLSQVVLARSHDAGRSFQVRASVEEPGRDLVHPRIGRIGDKGALGLLAETASGQLLFRREPFSPASRSVVLRSDLRVALRRSDPAWAGDYIGFASEGARAYAAFVDARPLPRVAFLAFTP